MPEQFLRKLGLRICAPLIVAIFVFGIIGAAAFATPVSAATPSFAFSNYEVSQSRDVSTAGVTCPNSGSNCWNVNGEPNIATAPDGTIYITSENTAFNHASECPNAIVTQTIYICGGTGAWKSTDGGAHFTSLTSPNVNFVAGNPVTFWGGDTQPATATARNSNGQYNVYVVSLEAAGSGLIGDGLATSKDGGQTWSAASPVKFVQPISAPGVQDRPWIATYGANEVCVESHTGAVIPGVFCSFDAGLTFPQSSTAFDAAHVWLTSETSIPGALHIDPNSGIFYLPFSGVATPTEAASDSDCGSPLPPCPIGFHTVYMAVSTDGGLTFTDYPVYTNPNTHANYGEQFIAMAIDKGGNVYEVYSDGVNLFYSYSTTHGQTWHGPYQVNKSPSNWALEPWAAAGAPGKIDIVWYGSPNCGSGVTDADNCQNSATWSVYMAQNLNVITSPGSFTQTAVTGTIHTGPVCENGSNCQSYRGLFDDFGVTVSPSTGLATIVYNNDQYTPNNPRNLPNPDCTSQYTTSADPAQQNCVHTNIAHQTSGPGVLNRHRFSIENEELKEVDSTHAENDATIRNSGDASITGLTATIAGVSAPLTLGSALPVAPGGTVSTTSQVSVANLALILGNAYPVTFTATFDDGTTLANSTSVVYSLP